MALNQRSTNRCVLLLALTLLIATLYSARVHTEEQSGPETIRFTSPRQLAEIRRYIKQGWQRLRRSNSTLIRSAIDPKVAQDSKAILYIAKDENLHKLRSTLRRQLKPSEFARIEIRRLPDDASAIKEHGLLYLPYPYVVPGGRFNEMYGWDSYFILLGLLRDNEVALAKAMTDNFIYEIERYGMILNANRTYYLTRSQPPFLTQMILNVYRRTGDAKWLGSALPAIEKCYRYWTSGPHFAPETGLSRYYGGEQTPAPEVLHGERDAQGRTHYDRVREYYRTHKVTEYDVDRYYDRKADRLTGLFFLGDRAMRESGFDPSNRFGPFSVDIIHYNPVDLNALLYRMEADAAAILTLLNEPRQARVWSERAQARAQTINQLMWNQEKGLYFDYNFEKKRQSDYRFITTFHPLWAGITSAEQAARIVANLPIFERAGGLQTSDNVSGSQWDAPFGWAPTNLIAIEGLRRYGYKEEADRISKKFLSMVIEDFARYGTIKEKYDVERRRSELSQGLKFGYQSNEIGFGWTNAVFLELLAQLTDQRQSSRSTCVPIVIASPSSIAWKALPFKHPPDKHLQLCRIVRLDQVNIAAGLFGPSLVRCKCRCCVEDDRERGKARAQSAA